jgi:hypothetical protein
MTSQPTGRRLGEPVAIAALLVTSSVASPVWRDAPADRGAAGLDGLTSDAERNPAKKRSTGGEVEKSLGV